MQMASQHFVGKQDFTAFSAVHAKDKDPDPVKEIHSLELKQRGPKITVTITGSGFLYKMVRSIVGTLYAVGRNRITSEDVLHILHSKKRTNKIVTAPASGLSSKKSFINKPTLKGLSLNAIKDIFFPRSCIECSGPVENSPYQYICKTCSQFLSLAHPPTAKYVAIHFLRIRYYLKTARIAQNYPRNSHEATPYASPKKLVANLFITYSIITDST